MKRIKILCVFILTIMLIGCSKNVTINVDEKNTIDGYINYEVLYSLTADAIEPPVLKGVYTYYKPSSTDNTLIDMVIRVENISKEKISVADLYGEFEIDGKEYDASTACEDTYTSISQSSSIEAGEQKILHIFAEIKKDTDLSQDITFTFNANKEKSELTYKIDDLAKKKDYQKVGYTFDNNDIQVKINTKITVSKIYPEKPSGYYQYYQADSDKQLTGFKLTVTNNSNEKIDPTNFIGLNVFTKDNSYVGEVISENENKSNLTDNETIESGQARTVYLVSSVEKTNINNITEYVVYCNGEEIYIEK